MNYNKIIEILNQKGSVVIIKTDTVYGFICNAYDEIATEKIYKLKSREKKKPLSIFVKDIDDIRKYVDDASFTEKNINLMNKYWPGALTIIFKKKNDVFSHITNGVTGIGIRIPNDKALLTILNEIDFPLAETSCNISGEEPYTNIELIKEKFDGKVELIIDGGETIDKPSTVISLEGVIPKIIRSGEIKLEF